MNIWADHLPYTLMILGVISLIIDMVLLGFSTFFLFFLGLSSLTIGFLMLLGIVPDTLTTAYWGNVVLTSILAILLWKPLKRFQESRPKKTLNNDFAQQQFVITEDVDSRGLTEYFFSGVKWKLKSRQPIKKNTLVEVVKVEVGVMWVQEASQ
ncbi:MAG: NfeD family protein [Venatoribacter sp.]